MLKEDCKRGLAALMKTLKKMGGAAALGALARALTHVLTCRLSHCGQGAFRPDVA